MTHQTYDPRGVRLVPDALTVRDRALAAVAKACLFCAKNAGKTPGRNHWSDDRDVELIIRSPVAPASTQNSSALATLSVAFVAALTPASAAAQVISKSLKLSFDGAATINVPGLSLPTAAWVGEGHAIPVIQGLTTSPSPVLQPYKLATIVTLTNELINSSDAEPMVRQLLIENCGPSLDVAMFGTGAGTPLVQPPGILNAIAPLAASTASGLDAMIADLGAIGAALGPASGGSTPVIVGSPGQALSMRLFAPDAVLDVYSSNALPAGTVVGIVPAGVATVVEAPRIDASQDLSIQSVDVPADELMASGPVYSMFQKDSVSLKLVMPATWVRRSISAAAWIQSVKW
jgi:hypothetical protein